MASAVLMNTLPIVLAIIGVVLISRVNSQSAGVPITCYECTGVACGNGRTNSDPTCDSNDACFYHFEIDTNDNVVNVTRGCTNSTICDGGKGNQYSVRSCSFWCDTDNCNSIDEDNISCSSAYILRNGLFVMYLLCLCSYFAKLL